MYKWFLAKRYLHTKLIAFFGIAAVTLCVAMVLVVMSVMGGFLDTVRARSRGLHSEIVLDTGTMQGFPYYEEFGNYVARELPDIVRITTPAIYSYGIFRIPQTTYTKPSRVLGIHLKDYVQVNDFGKGLHYDTYYPGTTHLGPQRMPIAGMDEQGRLTLPAELEQANAVWRDNETDPELIAAFEANPFATAPHPYAVASSGATERVFAAIRGEPMYVDPPYSGVIVGCDLMNDRRPDGSFDRYLARGAVTALTVMPLSPAGNTTGEPPIRLALRYVDDSRTGIYEIDNLQVYVDFDMLQIALAMDPQERIDGSFTAARTSQLLIGLHDNVDIDLAKSRLAEAWSSYMIVMIDNLPEDEARLMRFVDVYTWEDLQRPFISAIEKEKVLVTILFGLISMVAIVLVGCIFYMIVEKKTKDIGILKSLGASGRGVGTLFIAYAGAVGVVGSILGVIVGGLFVWYINDIQDFLASLDPQLRVWSADVYSFDKIPNVVKRADAIWIATVGVVASMIGSLIPAWIAGRVWPVEALRYE